MTSRSFSSLVLSSKLPTYSAAFRLEGFDLGTNVHSSSSSADSKGFSWRADGRDVFASGVLIKALQKRSLGFQVAKLGVLSYGRTQICAFSARVKQDRRDRRRFENLVRCEGHSTPATLVNAEARRDEGFLLEVRDQYLWLNMCFTIDPTTRPIRRHPL